MNISQINILDFGIKFASILFFVIWKYYWHITEKIADREKPKSSTYPKITFLRRESTTIIGLFILLQLIGWDIFPMSDNLAVQVFGMLLVGGWYWNRNFGKKITRK
ncbi:hypothetical protein CO051_04815 [Candidatus Roizmanbacteria bacterium CG_4_9_14_0_2_um_filter_39_13]|uniref:Uncharacterized protein n=2 Tax=Candidatus Roizmaniibacteriota TaxID=1752723 RepID=A0A2M8EXS1_9BACT|nr:MAG: hypothetical protein COY15_05045 [Candidatus Roizmanbacteria bacterium CG_4_10_14_0_2_um_filter_39_12]PJC30934.1 MAG: hypothetical protein CO051_04815 [Candidatus Roizmanbacteria bacterium CG_4_9_14_0_2_um_filter_39_13]PJE61978.1 MAG: hypothetical protein COU87_01780 [Candidatus Roizmanbacteria bacterium CG10_big_fil_rev_8_21_14_0_10_39_12]